MRYFIDTEFDGFRGKLISLALIREDGESRYWIIKDIEITNPWVCINVEPHLYKGSYEFVDSQEDMSREIARFLKNDPSPEIHADWPDDIKYFCDTMVFGPGKCRNIKSCKFVFDRELGSYESKVPHNAYYDALAIWEKFKNV